MQNVQTWNTFSTADITCRLRYWFLNADILIWAHLGPLSFVFVLLVTALTDLTAHRYHRHHILMFETQKADFFCSACGNNIISLCRDIKQHEVLQAEAQNSAPNRITMKKSFYRFASDWLRFFPESDRMHLYKKIYVIFCGKPKKHLLTEEVTK